MKQLSYESCHFHKVETWCWLRIRAYLNELLIARLQAGRECFTHKLSNFDFETVRDFLEQMDCAYLHPRRDSAHLLLCQSLYGDLAISDSLAHKVRSLRIALRSKDNKPKSMYQKV